MESFGERSCPTPLRPSCMRNSNEREQGRDPPLAHERGHYVHAHGHTRTTANSESINHASGAASPFAETGRLRSPLQDVRQSASQVHDLVRFSGNSNSRKIQRPSKTQEVCKLDRIPRWLVHSAEMDNLVPLQANPRNLAGSMQH